MANVATNKNTVPGDKSALIPGGLRVGTPAMTTRGFREEDFVKAADIIHKGVLIALDVQSKVSSPKLVDYKTYLEESGSMVPEIAELREEVTKLARGFPGIGF
jgi:glycine hydroxymethyltransferase